jgi:hypothetical protein
LNTEDGMSTSLSSTAIAFFSTESFVGSLRHDCSLVVISLHKHKASAYENGALPWSSKQKTVRFMQNGFRKCCEGRAVNLRSVLFESNSEQSKNHMERGTMVWRPVPAPGHIELNDLFWGDFIFDHGLVILLLFTYNVSIVVPWLCRLNIRLTYNVGIYILFYGTYNVSIHFSMRKKN